MFEKRLMFWIGVFDCLLFDPRDIYCNLFIQLYIFHFLCVSSFYFIYLICKEVFICWFYVCFAKKFFSGILLVCLYTWMLTLGCMRVCARAHHAVATQIFLPGVRYVAYVVTLLSWILCKKKLIGINCIRDNGFDHLKHLSLSRLIFCFD